MGGAPGKTQIPFGNDKQRNLHLWEMWFPPFAKSAKDGAPGYLW